MAAVFRKAVDEGHVEMALGMLRRGEIDSIMWNSNDPEMRARHERMWGHRTTLYTTQPHPDSPPRPASDPDAAPAPLPG